MCSALVQQKISGTCENVDAHLDGLPKGQTVAESNWKFHFSQREAIHLSMGDTYICMGYIFFSTIRNNLDPCIQLKLIFKLKKKKNTD